MAEKLQQAKALRTLPEAELRAELEASRRALWDGRMNVRAGSLQQPHRLRQSRRQIARILTVLRGHDA